LSLAEKKRNEAKGASWGRMTEKGRVWEIGGSIASGAGSRVAQKGAGSWKGDGNWIEGCGRESSEEGLLQSFLGRLSSD